MSTTSKLDVIIINYNSDKSATKLINSLKIIDSIIERIIIIDNKSKYFYLPKNKKIKVFKNQQNLGFAKAVNIGIKNSNSDFILLLNPDSYLVDDSIKLIFKQIVNDKKIGIIGGKIIGYNNQLQPTANLCPNFLTGLFEFTNLKKIFPNNPFSKNFWPETKQIIEKPIEVGSLCGAFMLIRKKQNQKLALFNEKYFLYLEDLDFGLATLKRKYKIIFNPKAKIFHKGGGSNSSIYKIVLKEWYKSRKIFFKDHLNIFPGTILYIIFSIEECLLKIFHKIKNASNY